MRTRWLRGALGALSLATGGCFQPTDIESQDGGVVGTETDATADTGQDGHDTQSSAEASASQDGSEAEGSVDADATGNDPTSPTSADPTADTSGDAEGSRDATDPTSADPATTDPATGDPATTDPATTDPATSDPSSGDPTGDDDGRCVPQCGVQECGDDPVCGESCAGCDPGETCLDDGEWCGTEIGQPDALGFSGDVNPNVLFGHRITVAEAVDLRRFGVIADGSGTARMALFAHDGNGPSLLLAESEEMDLFAGNNESEISPLPLDPGTYWIGIVVEGTTSLERTANGDDSHELFYAVLDYDAVMPASLASDAIVNDLLYNLYVVVDDDD
jgi:hypothetical protein